MRQNPIWQRIFADNSKYFDSALEVFNNEYRHYVSAYFMGTGQATYLSKLRFDEFSRACADDIYRYSTYHPLRTKSSILESVRASYMVKWLLHFRPILLDSYSTMAPEEQTLSYLLDSRVDTARQFYRRCNELFAIFLASYILGVHNLALADVIGRPCLITDFMDRNFDGFIDPNRREMKDFLYTLRYRIGHQDVYRPLFRRFESMSKPTKDDVPN